MNVRMSVECWWNDTDREAPMYLDRNLSQCHFVHHKPHRDWPGLNPVIRGEGPATDGVKHDSYFYPLFPQTNLLKNTYSTIIILRRSHWPRGLRRGPAVARLLELRVWIPAEAWVSVCCECCVLLGGSVCVGLITHPEESYWTWCVWVWSRNLKNEPLAH